MLLGNGDGTFQRASVLPSSVYGNDFGPIDVALADVNHDGQLDILVANLLFDDFGVSVLLGKGDGTFPTRFGVMPPIDEDGSLAMTRSGSLTRTMTVSATSSPGLGGYNGGTDQSAWLSLQNGDGTFAPASALARNGSSRGLYRCRSQR